MDLLYLGNSKERNNSVQVKYLSSILDDNNKDLCKYQITAVLFLHRDDSGVILL